MVNPFSIGFIIWIEAMNGFEEKLRGVGAQIRRMGNVFAPRGSEEQ